jgi:hypothetical protein
MVLVTTRQLRWRRSAWLGLAVTIVALVAGDVGAMLLVANRARPVSVSSAVARFRMRTTAASVEPESTPAIGAGPTQLALGPSAAGVATSPIHQAGPAAHSSTPPARGGPPVTFASASMPGPGVYLYDTTGDEEVSVMGGARHNYPAQTTITVTATPCGRELRWDALQQRWDDLATCMTGPAIDVARFSTHHQFFGINDDRSYDCPAGTELRPAVVTPGTTSSGSCAGQGAATTVQTTVVGIENVAVGNTAVPTVHIHVEQMLSGSTSGTRISDVWFATANGLIARMLTTVDGRSSTPVGESSYHEKVSLNLTSLTPRT